MDERKETDSAVIYLDIREKVFLVVAEAKQPTGARGEIGEPVRIADAELESQIAHVLLQHLDSFQTNVYSTDTARRGTPEQNRTFRRKHLSVTVERPPSGALIIIPMHHSKGGYSGSYAEKITVHKEDVPVKIPAALREAFGLAT